jgi:hypothetical protein
MNDDSKSWKEMKHGKLYHCHMIKKSLEVNEFLRLNIIMMEP